MNILEADPSEGFAFRRLTELYRARDGNLDGLAAELTVRVEADADAYAPPMLLAHLRRAQGHLPEARELYLRARALRPTAAAPLSALARLASRSSAPAEAFPLYDQALERTRARLEREELLREAGALAIRERDWGRASAFYASLVRGRRSSLYARTEFARALAGAQHWERAVEEYQRVLRTLGGDNRVLPPILLELARAQLSAGRSTPAIETLERALRAAGRQAGIRLEIYDQMLTVYRRVDRLSELADRLSAEAGRSFEANELLGRVRDELGQEPEALQAYRRALAARPRDIDTRLRLIQLLSRSGRLDEVVREYRALIRSAPREPRFVIELAQLQVQTGQRADALRLLRDAGRRHPRDVSLHQQLAQLYARWNEPELAAREIQRLASIEPREPAHLIALGASHFDRGDREAALRTWRRLIEVETDPARGHATLGGVYADHDLLALAVDAYREAVRLAPDELTYVRGLATTLERRRRHAEAETQWSRVLELAANDRLARREARERIVGIWSRSRGALRSRLGELELALQRDPSDVEAGRFLAEALRRRGGAHLDRAERVLEQVVRYAPGDVEAWLALERIRRLRGDLAGAIEALARLRDADSRRASHYLQRMAEHALALYRDDEALGYAREAVERNPEDATGHHRLGDLYRARQDTAPAISAYRRALELNERLFRVYFDLAELHLARSESVEADRLYRRLLSIAPDDDLVARAARASIQIHLGDGTLPALERDLLPLALRHPQRPIFRRVVVELYDAYAAPLVAAAARGDQAAESELRQLGTRGIKPLLEALADADPDQRRIALGILGELGNRRAAAPLLALAENSQLPVTQRMTALRAASSVADPALTQRFIELAESGDPRLRGLATWALGRLGGPPAVRALRRLFSSGSRGQDVVRGFAAIGLGLAGERETLLTAAPVRPALRYPLTWALGRSGRREDTALLIRFFRASEPALSALAADALGRIGGEAAEAALVEGVFSPDRSLRAASARGLRRGRVASVTSGVSGPQVPLPSPEPFESVSDYVQRIVAREDVVSGPLVVDPSLWLPALERATGAALSGDADAVLAAIEVLTESSSGLSLGALTAGWEEWPANERASVRSTLDALEAALVDDAVALTAHLDGVVRAASARLLVRLDDPATDVALAELLTESSAEIRGAALEALRDTTAVPASNVAERVAEILLREREWPMRTRAARALARATHPAARAALREALAADPYAFAREASASALASQPLETSDVEALESALRDDAEVQVRRAALEALLVQGGAIAARAVAIAQQDPDLSLGASTPVR